MTENYQAPPAQPNLTAKLGEHDVRLNPKFPRFAFMGLAAAQAGRSQEKMTEAVWRVVQAIVADFSQVENLMAEDDDLFDQLESFIENAMDAYNLDGEQSGDGAPVGPTVEPSDSSPSSTDIEPTSRVVSLERGTVEVIEGNGSTAGTTTF